ncbi:unnamed protein product, partial [marine sediment metagenome]
LLDDLGLGPAVQWYARNRLEETDVEVHIEVDASSERLTSQVETALFRIAQEGVNNIARHAKAKKAILRLDVKDSKVTLMIQDDGQGFDVEYVRRLAQEKRNLGLFGIEERVSLFEGTLSIKSQPGQGTQLVAALPLSGDG